MPRSGPPSYTYVLPPIYLAIPGTTITAAQHNDPLEDIAATFNTVQPIVWGGTGSSSAAAAIAALGGASLTTANTFTANQTIRLADDGATAGPLLTLDRNSATPAASDVLGEVVFSGRDSGAGVQTYGLVGADIVDPTAASEDGRLFLQSVIAGTLATRAYVGAGVYSPNATLGDGGADTINFPTYLLNGVSSFPNGFLYGCAIANNAVDATNDIDFAAGKCADSTNVSIAVCTAKTKQLDSNWVAGTNTGMRYSGAAIANTTYHLYAVWKAGGVDQDYYADPSAVAATVLGHLQAEPGGSAYAYVRRVGSIVRTGGAIKAFVQNGDDFDWSIPVADVVATNPGNLAVTATLRVPTGVAMRANITAGINTASTGSFGLVTALSAADTAPSSTLRNMRSDATIGEGFPNSFSVMTDTSAQVRYRIDNSSATTTVYITTFGWHDARGRLA